MNLQVKTYVNIRGLRPIFPAWSRNFINVHQQLVHSKWGEVVIATLPRKVLNALDRVRTILRGFDDNAQSAFDFGISSLPQHQLGTTKNAGQRVIEIVRYS